MMVWEGSNDQLVKLCVEFRKAVVQAIGEDQALGTKIMSAFSPEELQEFQQWSTEAVQRAQVLQSKLNAPSSGRVEEAKNARIIEELDTIVLEMSEKSAQAALKTLGQEELEKFITADVSDRPTVSEAYAKRGYPHLARLFSPR